MLHSPFDIPCSLKRAACSLKCDQGHTHFIRLAAVAIKYCSLISFRSEFMVHKSIKLIQETAYRSGMRPIWNLVYIQINIWFLFFFFLRRKLLPLRPFFMLNTSKQLPLLLFLITRISTGDVHWDKNAAKQRARRGEECEREGKDEGKSASESDYSDIISVCASSTCFQRGVCRAVREASHHTRYESLNAPLHIKAINFSRYKYTYISSYA